MTTRPWGWVAFMYKEIWNTAFAVEVFAGIFGTASK